jgi:glycosyltransferase involved in cell wall biosynthesis
MTPLLPSGSAKTAERCSGIPVGRVRYPRRPLIGGGVMCLRFAAFLWRRRRRYDAWHVHIGHHMGAITCWLGSLLGKPVVLKISGWWELEQGLLAPGRAWRRPLAVLARRCLRRATAIQATSTRIATELARRGFPAQRIVRLPNAVDTTRFRVRAPLRTPGTPFTAVFVGRLVPEKGLTTLLDAWAEAFRGRRDVRLRLVGGGPLEKELRQQAERLGIAAQVELTGPVDRVEDVLVETDIGVLPSRIEGLSNTLLELMACGLPVLATRVSGSEDFVAPGRNGWLCPVSDVAALSAALREAEALAPEKLSQLGKNARADVASAASLDTVVGRLLALYRGS